METKPTVFIVDDDPAVRESIRWLVESVDFRAETFASAAEFLDAGIGDRPGCVVLDVRMPGMSGLDLQSRLEGEGIHQPVIIVTGHGEVRMAVRALKSGAFDFLEKPFSDQMLLDRVQAAIATDAQARQERAKRAEMMDRVRRLTPRELEVMQLVVAGKANKVTAAALGISPKTVEIHRANVMRKTGADSVAELVRISQGASVT